MLRRGRMLPHLLERNSSVAEFARIQTATSHRLRSQSSEFWRIQLLPNPASTSMRNLKSTSLIFELSKPGRRGAHLPKCDVPGPELKDLLPADALATEPLPLPEV